MDLVGCCSVSSSRCSSSSASAGASTAADRMEMEAAEALAGLAHLAMRENGNCKSSGKWGSKGKRGQKRVKCESPLDDSVLNRVVDSVSDFALDRLNPDKQHDHPCFSDVVINPSKLETNADISETNLSFVKSYPLFGGGRSRQNLTEDEKEERRLRRILANRESARQTIRRRQALCEDLTRKAADLAWENESLKREKELALKEYQSLESKNKHLKEQTAKLMETEKEEISGGLNSSTVEKCPSPTANCPLLFYNQHPFSPLCWPSIIQSSNGIQSNHGPQNANAIPPNISLPPNGKFDSAQQQKENLFVVNGAQTPVYILSCPWFFPVTDRGNGQQQQQPPLGLKHRQEGMSINNQYSSSSLPPKTSLPDKVKTEAVTSATAINDLNEMPVEFSPDGGCECATHHAKGTAFSRFVQTNADMKNETRIKSEFVPYTDGICTESWQRVNALPGNQDSYSFSRKKLVDAAAATEARKRRKELTKLKNLHGRQCRMNC